MNLMTPDVLADLPQAIHDDLRFVLSRIANAGLPLERNPNMPSMIATKVENTMFQVTVLFAGGFPSRVAILGPGPKQTFGDPSAVPLQEWERDVFFALLPDELPELMPDPPIRSAPIPMLPESRELLMEIWDEIRLLRMMFVGEKPQ